MTNDDAINQLHKTATVTQATRMLAAALNVLLAYGTDHEQIWAMFDYALNDSRQNDDTTWN